MPAYDYKCLSCGATYEIIHKHDNPNVPFCELCKNPLTKMLPKKLPGMIVKEGATRVMK
jgi:putative FmdB family regulatory protein